MSLGSLFDTSCGSGVGALWAEDDEDHPSASVVHRVLEVDDCTSWLFLDHLLGFDQFEPELSTDDLGDRRELHAVQVRLVSVDLDLRDEPSLKGVELADEAVLRQDHEGERAASPKEDEVPSAYEILPDLSMNLTVVIVEAGVGLIVVDGTHGRL